MASVPEPVDHVEDEEEDWHGDEEEAVHVDVILAANVPPRKCPSTTALHRATSPVTPEKWALSN